MSIFEFMIEKPVEMAWFLAVLFLVIKITFNFIIAIVKKKKGGAK